MSPTYLIKKIVPRSAQEKIRPLYHRSLALLGALLYRFPSRKLIVIGVTGTKGKTTTIEIINSILEEAGYKTAVISTLRFKAGDETEPNLMKMTMPGRFFIQKMLRRAVTLGCTHAVVEMTSEGAKQFRNTGIDLDALLLTNIAPEHIESHGSYENYVKAKLSIAEGLSRSQKTKRILVVNKETPEAEKFLSTPHVEKHTYTRADADRLELVTPLRGDFNLTNAAGAATLGLALGIPLETIRSGIKKCTEVRGRMEFVTVPEKEIPFEVVVDYAHTPDSLEAVYASFPGKRLLCVLGGTGGGRDTWKRPKMGEIADKYCSEIFVTDEDPYDEDPRAIAEAVASGIKNKSYEIEMDRRVAIQKAISKAGPGDVILITGKGTDPAIMGPDGTRTPWSDKRVAEEELTRARA